MQSMKTSQFTHTRFWDSYATGKAVLLTFLKHHGLAALPTNINGSLCEPVLLEQAIKVTQSFCFFMQTASFSDWEVRVLSGSILSHRPVSSQLQRLSSVRFSLSTNCCSCSLKGFASLASKESFFLVHSDSCLMPWQLQKHQSQPLQAWKGCMESPMWICACITIAFSHKTKLLTARFWLHFCTNQKRCTNQGRELGWAYHHQLVTSVLHCFVLVSKLSITAAKLLVFALFFYVAYSRFSSLYSFVSHKWPSSFL